MIFHLVNIRRLQLFRLLNGLGLYVILIAGAFIFFVYASYLYFQKSPDCYLLTAAIVLMPLGLHLMRDDTPFVYRHLANPQREIYTEYALLVSPFTLPALLTANWYCAPAIYALLIFIPYYKPTPKRRTRIKKFSGLINSTDFEWISGTRRIFITVLILYAAALMLSWFKIVPLFLLWVITALVSSFYEESESLQILRANGLSSSKLIHQKLFYHLRYLIILFMPVLIINTIFNPGFWLINILFLVTQMSLVIFYIVFKYTMYQPQVNLKSNSIITGVVSVGSLLPFFFPVPLCMSVIYYFKSRKNLLNYLYD